jgi:hypothetical protein
MTTPKSDLEISKALALAIGHKPEDIFEYEKCIQVSDHEELEDREFDYRDWTVIAPIAERYDCFPVIASCHNDEWHSMFGGSGPSTYADTPQKAIALAVIGAKQ